MPDEVRATNMPVQKVQAGGVAGALVMLVMFGLKAYKPNLEIPQGVEAALTTVFSFVVAYLVPPGKSEAVLIGRGSAESATSKPAELSAASLKPG
jgi:hypothetical protein